MAKHLTNLRDKGLSNWRPYVNSVSEFLSNSLEIVFIICDVLWNYLAISVAGISESACVSLGNIPEAPANLTGNYFPLIPND